MKTFGLSTRTVGALLGVWSVAAGAAAPVRAADTANRIENGRFTRGLEGWNFRPGNRKMTTLKTVPGIPGRALFFHPRGENAGLNSAALEFGRDLQRDQCYRLTGRVQFGGLRRGIAALSVCLYDGRGKRLRQYALLHWTPHSKRRDWTRFSAVLGPGTAYPFLAEAARLRVRLSFFDRGGKCTGEIALADVALRPARRNRFADWPASILVDCGDLQTRFESRSFWTLYRLDYRGKRLCVDHFGSHYGSVANFPGTGFIGSGHSEQGETEQVESLTLSVDGRRLDPPPAHVAGRRIVLHKKSRIRTLALETTVTVLPDRIIEAVEVRAETPQKLNVLYHFMHPWVTAMDRFLAVTTGGTVISGKFTGDKRMKVDAPVRWSAVYSDALQMGAVTVVLQVPPESRWRVWYWDMPGRYRKHYFVTFRNQTIPAGRRFSYRIVTLPFAAGPERWKRVAESLAARCLQSRRSPEQAPGKTGNGAAPAGNPGPGRRSQ